MSFVLFGASSWPYNSSSIVREGAVNVAGECQRCRAPVSAVLKHRAAIDVAGWARAWPNLVKGEFSVPNSVWALIGLWPERQPAAAPDYLPESVERAFMQGETNLAMPGHEEPAATMFRRALDLALKVEFPELKGDLNAKIKKLAETHVIPKALADWAHEVRGIGNDGAHDLDGCTQDDAQAARDFVDAILRYLITLPAMIEQRRPGARSPMDSSDGSLDEDSPTH